MIARLLLIFFSLQRLTVLLSTLFILALATPSQSFWFPMRVGRRESRATAQPAENAIVTKDFDDEIIDDSEANSALFLSILETLADTEKQERSSPAASSSLPVGPLLGLPLATVDEEYQEEEEDFESYNREVEKKKSRSYGSAQSSTTVLNWSEYVSVD